MSQPDPSMQEILDELTMYKRIFNSINLGATVIDPDGKITHMNDPYGRFLGIDPEKQIGKHCTEVLKNTRMHIVAKTGKAEVNKTQHIHNTEMVVQRIPIKEDGKVIAVFGQVIFKDISDVQALAKKLTILESKVQAYQKELYDLKSTRYTFDSIMGESAELEYLKQKALQAAGNDSSVMITGDSGTGKELFAQAIHHASPRRYHPFIRINCAAIPKDLMESELFGYEAGAFTGAKSTGKPGKFEMADKGTIFLDEIGDLPLEMQPKLLRVLEEREFEKIGGTKIQKSDFRVICATNQNLEALIGSHKFRKDLYYRLNVFPIEIPPLRQRKKDIPIIARHLLSKLTREAGLPNFEIDEDAQKELLHHDWPGNVRELSNVLERAMYSAHGTIIVQKDLPFATTFTDRKIKTSDRASLKSAQQQAQIKAIYHALKKTGYNKSKAAEMLGIHRTLLYKKLKEYNIDLQPNEP